MRARFQLFVRALGAAIGSICLMTASLSAAETGKYVGPTGVAAAPDGKSLFVVASDSGQILVVDVESSKIVRAIPCATAPTGAALSEDGTKLYVTCAGPKGVVCVVEVATGKIEATIPVGHTPGAPVLLADGKRLFVCNRFNNDVSVIDVASRRETARVPAVREPVGSAATPDGRWVFVANLLPLDPADSYNVAAEVTVINTESLESSRIRLPNGSTSVHQICMAPRGDYAYVTHILSRYQMPTTQLERGWMNTNALSVIDVAQRQLLNTVLLDDIDLGAAIPWGVATMDEGKKIVVSHASTHELSVIDAEGLLSKLNAMPKTIDEAKAAGRYDLHGSYASIVAADVPNDLAYLVDLRRRIPLQRGGPWGLAEDEGPLVNGPRGLAVIGTRVYAALYFSDALAVVDLEDKAYYPVKLIPLGPQPTLTIQRRGEMLFHDGTLCFQHWQSCASCHPDARVDALNWDLLNDGLGTPKNNRSMLYAHRTPPAMSHAVRASAEVAVRAGIKFILFTVQPEEDAVAIDEYLKSLEPTPSPYLVDGKLSPAAERGNTLFHSERLGCSTCHPAPLYTDQKLHDVESKGPYDRMAEFDTPTLIESWRTAPYLHDGRYTTIEEVFKKGQHGSVEGDVESLTDEEIHDLSEFVRSL